MFSSEELEFLIVAIEAGIDFERKVTLGLLIKEEAEKYTEIMLEVEKELDELLARKKVTYA